MAALGAPPAATRASQTGGVAATPVAGFLAVNGERIESTNALADRLGTPGLKGAPRLRCCTGRCRGRRVLASRCVADARLRPLPPC
jgi:hypothetical protein